MKKQPDITDKTRQAFIDVFCELYCQKPIEKISVQEVANKSGYNRSTFYQYFSDIYELLSYVENDVLDYLTRAAQKKTGSIQDIISLYEAKGAYLDALLGDYGNNRFIEQLKIRIPAEEQLIGLSEENILTPYLMEFHISTTLSMFRLWHRRKKDLTTEKLLELIICLYTTGVSSIVNQS